MAGVQGKTAQLFLSVVNQSLGEVNNVIYISSQIAVGNSPKEHSLLTGKDMAKPIILLSICLLIQLKSTLAFNYCNTSLYTSVVNGYPRYTLIEQGDFALQAIFSQTRGSSCNTIALEGVISVTVLQLALQHVVASNILPGFRLGYQVDNGCTDIPRVMKRGIEIVSMYRPNSVCRADFLDCKSNITGAGVQPISAVLGPGYSFLTIPLASLMGLYHIPHISYQASSRLLSKRDLYKSFFRTIPSDSNQVLVMLDMMKRFNWNYLFAIGSDDDYGKLGVSALKESASARNICIAYDAYIPNSGNNVKAKVAEIINKIIATPKARLIVLFTYSSMGELILQEAQERKIHRMWLTSDAWSSSGPRINVSENYLTGILTVATEKIVIPGLDSYLQSTIENEPLCNPWLTMYLRDVYKCKFDKSTICPGETPQTIARKMLSYNSGGYANLYDAVFAVSHSISSLLEKRCGYKSGSFNRTLCYPFSPKELLTQLAIVNFTGIFSRPVNFDKNGGPKTPHYIIENMQMKDGKMQYVRVGTWDKLQSNNDIGSLNIDVKNIVWPPHYSSIPGSKCSIDCIPGQYVHAKTECCWSCQECEPLHVSNISNAPSCVKCPPGHHTDKQNTKCIETPVVYLTSQTGAGVAILTVSCIGLVLTVILAIGVYKIRNSHMVQESQPAIVAFSIAILLFSFAYGTMHVVKPNDSFCSARSAYFFMLFGTFTAMLLASTLFVRKTMKGWLNRIFNVGVNMVQYVAITIVVLIQLLSVIIWLEVDPVKVKSFPNSDKTELFLECNVGLTATRLICMALPCVVLLIAMIIAFKDRNIEHPYNEPKFLSFSTIALAIIVVAFIPTFKYVVGLYKSIVMAFTVDLCAYTYISCMYVPKLYILVTQCSGHADVTGDNAIPDTTCSVHEIAKQEHSNNGKTDVPDNTSALKVQYIVKDSTAPEIQLIQKDGKQISLPPSPSSDTRASPSRKGSDTGSGSRLMVSHATFV